MSYILFIAIIKHYINYGSELYYLLDGVDDYDINHRAHGFTVLTIYTNNVDGSLTCKLAHNGANIEDVDDNGNNALSSALSMGDKFKDCYICELIDRGADVNHIYKGKTILYIAREYNRSDEVIEYIKKHILQCKIVDTIKEKESSRLWDAIKGNADVSVIKKLISLGLDVNYESYGISLLYMSISHNKNPLVIIELIKAGADVNKTYDDISPLWLAAYKDIDFKVILELIDKDANVNYVHNGITPLYITCSWSSCASIIIKELLKKGADVNYTCNGTSPLWLSSELGDAEAIMELIKKGADVNHRHRGLSCFDMIIKNRKHIDIRLVLEYVESPKDIDCGLFRI